MESTVPSLKLIVTKGPRSVETLEFKPGSVIRIGRIKRGNTYSIAEDGISTKHLCIESKSSGKWTLEDLDSSNGTILNSTDVTPNTPVDLHDDDIIKFGEETAILVKFEAEPPPRRVTRSQLKDEKVVENVKIKVEEAAEEEVEGRVTRRGRGRRRNVPVVPSESGGNGGVAEEKMKCEQGKEEEAKEKASQVAQKGRGRGWRRNVQTVENDVLQIEGDEACGGVRATRNGRGRRKNVLEMQPESSTVQVETHEALRSEDVGGGGISGVKDGGQDSGRMKERVGSGEEDKSVDLEKMTLGEWFNYMEVNLPKLIIKETEEMIEEMNKKAVMVHEYMKQQKKEKEKPML